MARRSRKFNFSLEGWRKWLFALLFLAGGVLVGIRIGEWTAPKQPTLVLKPAAKKSTAASRPAPAAPAKPLAARVDREKAAERYDASTVPSLPPARPRSTSAPKVAIVLDDWGYNLRALPAALEIREPLTLAVLPHLPHSSDIASKAHAAGHEVMLHMPMEPLREVPLEKGTILASMSALEVRGLLVSALADVPFVRGVNNHMGSKVTQDRRALNTVMTELKSRGLFFLNSLTSGSSVGREVAGDLGIDYAERDIFLDNERTEEAVTRQLQILKETAVRQGSAIGIGHDEPVTLRAIQKILPSWRAEGIEVMKLSDLIRFHAENT